jgi:hypothetical protein
MTNSDNATNLIVEIVHSIAAEYGFPPEYVPRGIPLSSVFQG